MALVNVAPLDEFPPGSVKIVTAGSITVGVFYHVPGNGTWFYSGVSGLATFNGTSSATYNLAAFTNANANSYRIQVLDAAGLRGGTTKSASVPGCTGTTTTTTATRSTASSGPAWSSSPIGIPGPTCSRTRMTSPMRRDYTKAT